MTTGSVWWRRAVLPSLPWLSPFFLLTLTLTTLTRLECDRTIGSFSHQSGITREQLSLPLASPPSPSGIRGILWVVQSIDLWLVSRSLDDDHEVQRSPPRWPLRRPPRPRRTHRRGLSRLRDRPQLRLRANKLPSPNHCESRDFLLVNKNLSLSRQRQRTYFLGCQGCFEGMLRSPSWWRRAIRDSPFTRQCTLTEGA